jgi:hypothetical protein
MKQNATSKETDVDVLPKTVRRLFNTPTEVLACISVVLNILVIATFLKIRKSRGKLPQGAIQLLILAISETAASLSWPLGLVYCLFRENGLLGHDKTLLIILFSYGGFCSGVSRFLTLYIAASKVYVMWSFRHAHRNLQKTEKDHIRETILFGILPGGASSLVLGVTSALTSVSVVNFGYICVLVVVIAFLASYMLWRISRMDVEFALCTNSSAAKVMQKTIVAVTFFFCFCHIPVMIENGELAFNAKVLSSIPAIKELAQFFYVSNYACNFFIYMAFGKTFRRNFSELFIKCGEGAKECSDE